MPAKPQSLSHLHGVIQTHLCKDMRTPPPQAHTGQETPYQAIVICHDVILHPCQGTKLFPAMMTSEHFLRGRNTAQCQAVQ